MLGSTGMQKFLDEHWETQVGDDPLEPMDNDYRPVIDLASVRIRLGKTSAKVKPCEHKHLTYSQHERRVWCDDCERSIDAFDAFVMMCRYLSDMISEANGKMHKADEALRHTARLRATKALDKVWSGRTMAVACPHCNGGLLPEDFAGGAKSAWSRSLEIAKRTKARDDALTKTTQST